MQPNQSTGTPKPWYKKKIVWIPSLILIILVTIGIIIYMNYNRLISEALHKSFENSLVSDVYELKFEKLNVDFVGGNISVSDVVMQPLEKPLKNYPYINSSYILTTRKMVLKNVRIRELLRDNKLQLDKIEIVQPDIAFDLSGKIHVFFPFKDSTHVSTPEEKKSKKTVESYFLQQFKITDGHFKVINKYKEREFSIAGINFSFDDLYLSQLVGVDSISVGSVSLSVDSLTGTLYKSGAKHVKFSDFKFNLEKVDVQKTKDTAIFDFKDVSTSVHNVDLITADSIHQMTLGDFDLSYKNKSITLTDVEFKSLITEQAMQKRFQYQNTQAEGSVKKLEIKNINFDSLIYKQALFVDEVQVTDAVVALYKDKTKPIDPKRFPDFPGQNIVNKIKIPLLIKKVIAKNVTINNRERKPDGEVAMVNVKRLNGEITNVTNIDTTEKLVMKADAFLEDKVHFFATLKFDYINPQFSLDARIPKFELKDLNRLLLSYTPAKLDSGTVDELTLTATAYFTKSVGTMKFLYHNLHIDLKFEEQAKWKSSLGSFAANTAINSANPADSASPARVVKFEAERDMQKGFINLVIKSLIAGMKETMFMSKENREEHKEKKKLFKLRLRKDKEKQEEKEKQEDTEVKQEKDK